MTMILQFPKPAAPPTAAPAMTIPDLSIFDRRFQTLKRVKPAAADFLVNLLAMYFERNLSEGKGGA